MERKRHQRIFAMLTVFAMLFCSDGFGAFAESISGGEQNLTQTLCGKEEHRHTEECYENVTICGLNETKDKTEKRFNPFTVHKHGPECYNADEVLNCGIIEGAYYHTHNQYCFDKAGNLVCGLEEKIPHEHNESCYETEKKLICDKKEEEGHKHSDACYKEHAELTCGKTEEAGHQHNAACYKEHRELTCGKAEEAGHKHSDACYKEHTELTCGKNEDPGHHHSDACYKEHTELTCGKQEDPGHHHSDECYRDEQALTCELPEDENHTHTEACYTTLHTLVCEEAEREGHTHSESCYTTTRKLTCGEAERDGHTHSENCYTTTRELVCGTEEREGHTHGASCYTTTWELACGKEEREGHTHGTSCYTTKRELSCGKNESEGHKHTEACYTTETTLICTEPTTTHHHTGACRDTEGNLICGQQEIQKFVSSEDNWAEEVVSKGHHHSDACYEKQLVCGKEEHTHSDECYAAPESTQEAQNGQAADDGGNSANEGTTGAGSGKATGESTGEGEDPGEESTAESTEKSTDQTGAESADETGEELKNQAEEDPEAGSDKEPADDDAGNSDEKSTEESENPEKESTEISTEENEKTGEESDENLTEEEDGEGTEKEDSEEADEKDDGAEDEDGEEDGEETEEETDAENGEDEGDGEETGESKEKENEEEDSDEKDGAEDAEEGDGEETDEEELAEGQDEITITAEDAPYAVSISFSGDAGIPEGTKLVVSEAGEETETKDIQEVRYASKAAPMKSAGLRSAATPQERHIDIPSMTVWNAGEAVPDIILYQKTLDISLVSEGEEIEPDPAALITVTVQLPGIEDGQTVEVRHITDGGTELLESSNEAGNITFTTSGFSLFEFTSRAQALSTWSTGQTSNTFYGKTANQEAQASAVSVNDVSEGLEVLEAYSLTRSSDLWVVLQRIADIALGKMESIALYTVEDGQLGAIVRENVSLTDVLRFNLGDLGGYALVRDTGLRHIVTELGNITLDGMMPKNSAAEATDVREEYSDPMDYEETVAAYDIAILYDGEEYQPEESPIRVSVRNDDITAALEEGKTVRLWHITDDGGREEIPYSMAEGTAIFEAAGFSAYVFSASIEKIITIDGENWKVTVEYGDDAGIPEDAELEIREVEAGDYQAAAATAWNWTENNYIFYTKFLDISIVRNGETIEPLAPVSMTIQLLDVEAGAEALRVVHFGKDGAEAIEGQAGADGTIQFEADAFSVFGFGNALQPLASTETEEADLTIYGFGGEARLAATDAPEVAEGLEVLGAYTLSSGENSKAENSEEETGEETAGEETGNKETTGEETGDEATETTEENGNNQNALWIKAELKAEANLTDMESVVLCNIDGETTMPVTGELTTSGQIEKLEATNIALIKDTGYRHLNFVLEIGEDGQATTKGEIKENKREGEETAEENIEEDAGENPESNMEESAEGNPENSATDSRVIILDGMAPKAAEATVTDVTGNYAEHEYSVPEEEQGEETETEEQPGEPENGNPEEKQAAEGEETETGSSGETEKPGRITLAAYEISISNNETEYQPSTEQPIRVEIRDPRITAESNIELWHIKDDGTEERVEKFKVENGCVEFVSLGFSVYTIVEAPSFSGDQYGWHTIEEISEIEENKGYYLDHLYYYLTGNQVEGVSGDSSRYGLEAQTTEFTGEGIPSGIENALFYFEKVEGSDSLRIYKQNNGTRHYINMHKVNSSVNRAGLKFVTDIDEATPFTFEKVNSNRYRISATVNGKTYYWNRNTKGAGVGAIVGYSDVGDSNIGKIRIQYYGGEYPDNPYNLDGKTYSIVFHEESVLAAGLKSDSAGSGKLEAVEMVARPKALNYQSEMLIAPDTDLSEWTFEYKSGNKHYLKTQKGGGWKYLTLDGGNLILTDTPTEKSEIEVSAGSGAHAGKYRFSVGSYSLTLQGGKAANGFISSNSGGDYSWLNLVSRSDILEDDDFVIYSARKVNLSDRKQVPDKAQVVVYTRIWNDTTKRYEHYAINSAGNLVRCYESGDLIQWVGLTTNDAVWTFTEYTETNADGETVPNYFYELMNNYSGVCITPQVGEFPLRDSAEYTDPFDRSINMNGRRNGYFYSPIIAWDDSEYAYAGLKTVDKSYIQSCSLDQAESFYFAIMQDYHSPDEEDQPLTPVETIDHEQYGITMKIANIDTRDRMSSFLGNNEYEHSSTQPNLLSTNIDAATGYPTAKGGSLGTLFANSKQVNHLFIANTFYGSGYYVYDSTQNFATLIDENGDVGKNFTVYKELGSYDESSKHSLMHGQFFPFNTIVPGVYTTVNQYNLYSAQVKNNDDDKPLPDSNPRKNERLYDIEHDGKKADPHFAVELEASFTQTANGKDAWNHDIIYEFTGDDDFWLYVDGELIIDLGGIHGALPGKVNYATGEVVVNGVETTLRDLFYNNYKNRNHTDAQAQAYVDGIFKLNEAGQYVFKDYTTHTMNIYYMERGAGASNLFMRFNLASVKPGEVLLSKEITGVEENKDAFMAEYPYQIYYFLETDTSYSSPIRLGSEQTGEGIDINVVYKDTNRNVTYKENFTAADGTRYQNVFLLRPGETAEIEMPSNAIAYYITECCVDTSIYDAVSMNGTSIQETDVAGSERKDFTIPVSVTEERPSVVYQNHVSSNVLRTLTFTKKLFDETGENEIHHSENDTVFTFRLYLGTENDNIDNLPLAYLYKYHVRDEDGNYCIWSKDNKKFVSIGKDDYSSLTSDEKAAVSFNTSMTGTISNIPVDYTVELREVPAGTKYMVEERFKEIPDGYSLQKYVWKDDIKHPNQTEESIARAAHYVEADKDPHIDVCNLKGWGLRVQKVWTDESFMDERDSVHMAVYVNNNMIEGTLRELEQGETELYWYFPTLDEDADTFNDYVVREVTVTHSEEGEGNIITPIADGGTLAVNGKQIGETSAGSFTYTVKYTPGEVPAGSNVREDTVTNSRPGIKLIKKTLEGDALPGAEFTLTDSNGDCPGAESFVSDDTGLITFAYLKNNEDYTLTETSAPAGYQAATSFHATEASLVLRVEEEGQTRRLKVSGGDNTDYYEIKPGTDRHIATLVVYNKAYTLQIKKVKGNNEAMAGVHFALYKQVKNYATGELRKDYLPITGFEDLVSNNDGLLTYTDSDDVVQLLGTAFSSGKLKPAAYYITEKDAPEGFQPLAEDILFVVSPAGKVSLDPRFADHPELNLTGVSLDKQENERVAYQIIVPNVVQEEAQITIQKTVVGSQADTDGLSSFDFTARLYKPDGKTVWTYDGFENGIKTFTLTNAENENKVILSVPKGAVLSVTEDPNETSGWYDTKNQWIPAEGATETEQTGTVYQQTVGANGTIKFTNTRKKVRVTVKKELSDPLTKSGTFNFTGTLTDYSQDCTSDIQDLNSFDLTLSNTTSKSTYFMIPMGSSFTVTETAQDCYDTTYSSNNKNFYPTPVVLTEITSNQTITVKNTRKTKTVTVSKTLNDATESSAVSFPFTVTLYNTDGETTVNGYKLNGDTIKTGDGNNNTIAGKASFNLSVAHEETATQTLTVPYGAILKVEETVEGEKVYSTTITETIGENANTFSDTTSITTASITDDMTLAFTNELLEGNATLIISKTVVDDYTDSTEGVFEFIVSGLEIDTSYEYIPQTYDGTQWTGDTTTSETTDEEGILTLPLQHNQRVMIEIPVGKEVTVTETNSTGFKPSYQITNVTNESSTPEDPASGNSTGSLLMNGNKIVDFTNTREPVAPTGYSSRHTPYLLTMLSGFILMIIIGGVGIMRKRQANEDDDPTDPNIPPGFNTGYPVMNKEPCAGNQTLWREGAQVCNGYPQNTRSYPPVRGAPPCRRANLWIHTQGPPGKRGDPGG